MSSSAGKGQPPQGVRAAEVAATAGNACNTDGAGACETPTRLLVCQSGTWQVAADCKGPTGCQLIDDGTLDCDLRGNSIGDSCPTSSEGKVRCDPDGGSSILRCRSGLLGVEYTCPSGTTCQLIVDAGLTCD